MAIFCLARMLTFSKKRKRSFHGWNCGVKPPLSDATLDVADVALARIAMTFHSCFRRWTLQESDQSDRSSTPRTKRMPSRTWLSSDTDRFLSENIAIITNATWYLYFMTTLIQTSCTTGRNAEMYLILFCLLRAVIHFFIL